MKPVIPITFRLPADLKALVDQAAAARRLSLNAFAEVALRNEASAACHACGQPARQVARGATSEFADFIKAQRGGSIYVRLERRGAPVVFKGRLARIYGRQLHLEAESPSQGEQRILVDEVVDWEPGRPGTGTEDWDRAHPGVEVDPWGLG